MELYATNLTDGWHTQVDNPSNYYNKISVINERAYHNSQDPGFTWYKMFQLHECFGGVDNGILIVLVLFAVWLWFTRKQ